MPRLSRGSPSRTRIWPAWAVAGAAGGVAAVQLITAFQAQSASLSHCLPAVLSAGVAGLALSLGLRLRSLGAQERSAETDREIEERYRALFEDSPNGMVLVSIEGRYEIVNDAFAQMLGRTRSELEGAMYQDLVHPDDLARSADALANLVERGQTKLELEKRYLHADGSEIWTIAHATLRLDEHGLPAYILAEIIDNRERRAMEEQLRESESRHRAIAEVMSDYVYKFRFEPDGTPHLVWTTNAFERVFGCSLEEYNRLGGPARFVHPDDLQEQLARRDRVLRGETVEATSRHLRPDGEVIWLETISRPIIDDVSGKIIGAIGAARDVTSRVQAENALIASEKRLELALRGADLGVWDWNIKTNKVRMNRRWAEMLGWDLSEIGDDISEWSDRVHPDDMQFCRERLEAHFAGEAEQYEAIHRMRCKDGSWCWILDRGRVVEWDTDGSPLRAAGTHLDITESKLAIEALAESEQRLKYVMDATRDAIFDWDLKTGKVWRNDRYAEIFSLNGDVGDDINWWSSHVHPDDVERCFEGVKHAVDSKFDRWTTEYRFDRGDGEWRNIVDFGFLVRDDTGEATRIIGAMSDITERKRDEEAIRQSEARYRAVSDLTSDFVFQYSVESPSEARLDWVTDSFTKLLGRTAEELPDLHSLLKIVHPEDRVDFAERIDALLGGRHQRAEHRVIATDGAIVQLSWAARPEFDPHTNVITGLIGAGRDVTELRRTEETLQSIAAGVSEDVGAAFFQSLVTHLAESLGVKWALVGELRRDLPGTVRTIAVSENEIFVCGDEYELTGTPCETAMRGELKCYTSKLQERFPQDEYLVAMDAQSYIGMPLIASSGERLGILAVLHDEPMPEDSARATTLLRVFAARASAELERLRDEAALAASEERLELAVDGAELGLWDWDVRTGRVIFNERWASMLDYTLDELPQHFTTWQKLVHPDDLQMATDALGAHIAGEGPYCVEHRMKTKAGDWKWVLTTGKVVERDIDGNAVRAAGTHADIDESKRAARRQHRMMRELDHRVKNNLASVISIADCTLASVETLEDFRSAFVGRVSALSRLHQLLAVQRWDGVSLRDLVTRTMEAFTSRETGRVEITGPDMMLRPEAASPLCMSLHELSTNAAKYGALSTPEGRVRVSWERMVGDVGEEAVRLDWIESGGPPVTEDAGAAPGTGTELLRGLVVYELGGSAEIDYLPEGVACRIDFPLDREEAIRNIVDAERESTADEREREPEPQFVAPLRTTG